MAADAAPVQKPTPAQPPVNWVWEPSGVLGSLVSSGGSAALGQPQLLTRTVAHKLVYGWRTTERQNSDTERRVARLGVRGPELISLYRNAAPSVVLIVVGGGDAFGSGFLISKDGWLVTNHHVAKDALLMDDLTREVSVYFGRMNPEGLMEPIQERYSAKVYKWDENRDLALLKLGKMPSADARSESTPFLKVSGKGVPPGEDVAAIGNAALTLLWSLKPGVVQGVGRNVTDSAEVLREWEERTQASLRDALGNSYEAVKQNIESELGAQAKVLLIQATCPILPGDSGGPLLQMNGEVIGVNDFYRYDENGGHANYFIHARELRDFLDEKPARPLAQAPGFWDTEAEACKIEDLDEDGRFDTVALFEARPSEGAMRTKLVAIGWDLKEESSLDRYLTKAGGSMLKPQREEIDTEAVYQAKAMHVQAYLTDVNGVRFAAYDLNGDGYFELIRMVKADEETLVELTSAGPGKGWRTRHLEAGAGLLIRAERLPSQWRKRYQRSALDLFRSREK